MSKRKYRKRAHQAPGEPSPLANVPYLPNLRRVLHQVTACLIVSYLEIHHPAPEDGTGRLVSLPVTVDLDTMSRDLQVSRRTLALNIHAFATVFPSEARRFASARGAREFILPASVYRNRIALYSVVLNGRGLFDSHQIIIRRNIPALRHTFDTCQIKGLSTIGDPRVQTFAQIILGQEPHPPATQANAGADQDGGRAQVSPVPFNGLENILLRASTLAVDRRTVRYPRLRKAVASGLEGAEVLKVRRNKAVDPDLPEAMKERFSAYGDESKRDAEGH